ncbi:restin homolog isoform X2 [Copidosoma floridanum]|uniref:restin homolog isoform X2 n=1 Tax=Copidosoma floridanum TaxID=29053 RepID=UPI0006C942C1|nr:restin homolog isoform X2 [Copidosoma floridanum]XP_014215602.1 restin homolog isoform X2 [Copidosoma floridanum]
MEPILEVPSHRSSNTGTRRGSDNSVVLTEDTDSFIIGDHVWVGGTKPGQIAYIGETQFAPGDWAGIVLDEPIGKNDGSVAGCRYFQCEPKRGIFSRLTRLTRQPIPAPVSASSPVDKPGLAKSSLNTSTTSLASTVTTATTTKELQIGERVIVSSSQGSKTGVLRYMGATEFAPGDWCGVELDDPVGKNDGSVADKRYFECKAKHGLFAPMHKVSRSPSSRRSTCQAQRPTGASLNVSLLRSRAGSRESLASVTSTTTSIASRATAASTASSRDLLKDRQKEIEILRRERDLERERVTKAASQADEAEKITTALKKEFAEYCEETEKAAQETQSALAKLLEEKEHLSAQLEDERRKCEDLLFRFEEESIHKDDVQNDSSDQLVTNAKYESKIKELEKQLSEERERVIQLERDGTKLFEAEEELTKLRLETRSTTAGEKSEFLDVQRRAEELERAKVELAKLVEEKSRSLEEARKRQEENEKEQSRWEECRSNLQKQLDATAKELREKCAYVDELRNSFDTQTEELRKEIGQLKGSIGSIAESNRVETARLVEEHERALREKEELVRSKSSELKEESRKVFATQEGILEKLKAESALQIQELSESFRSQLSSRDSQIEQLEGKARDAERFSGELEQLKNACAEKEDKFNKISADFEGLNTKLKDSDERNASLSKRIDEMVCEHEMEVKTFADQKTKLEDDVASLMEKNTGLKEQLSKLEECIKAKDEELAKIQSSKTEELEIMKRQFEEQMGDKIKTIQSITADVSQKSSGLSALEKELDSLKSIIENKVEEIKNLSEKTSELRDTLSLSEQTKTNLESELRMYEANVSELTEKLGRAEEKISQLTSQKEKLEAEISSVVSTSVDSSDKLVKYSEDLRQKEKELDKAREREFELQKSLAAAQSKANDVEQGLGKANSLLEQLRSENEVFKTQVASEKLATQNALEKIAASQAVERELVDKNNDLQESLKKQSSELAGLTSSLETHRENNARLEKELAEARERCESEKLQLGKLEQQINEKGSDLDSLEKSNAQLLSDKQSMDATIKELNDSLNAMKQRAVDLDSVVVNKDAQIKELTSGLENLKSEREEAKKSLAEISNKYNDALTELTLLKSSNVNLESQMALEVANLKQQLEDEKRTLDTALKESKNHLDELNKELVLSSENNAKLNQRCMEMENVVSQKEKEVQVLSDNLGSERENSDSMRQQIQTLQEDVSGKDKEIASNANRISSLGEREKSLESNINTLKSDLVNKTELMVQLENKITELQKLCEDQVSISSQDKQKELDELLKKHEQELASKDAAIAELKKIGDSKEKSIQELLSKQTCTEDLLKRYEKDVGLKDKALDDLKRTEEATKKMMHDYEEKQKAIEDIIKKHVGDIKSRDKVIADLRNSENELEERIQNLVGQINYENEKLKLLEESQRQLEKENKKLSKSYNEAVAKLNITNEQLKNSTNNDKTNHKVANQKTEPIMKSATSDFEQLKEEHDLAKGQIEFLNSVIVDMQRKNEKMACKIQVLEMGIPAQEADDYNYNLIEKKSQPPRMFCDICDQFDLHETEDCPQQDQDPDPPAPVKTDKKVLAQRPYCDNCEMFGHDTQACEETETY